MKTLVTNLRHYENVNTQETVLITLEDSSSIEVGEEREIRTAHGTLGVMTVASANTYKLSELTEGILSQVSPAYRQLPTLRSHLEKSLRHAVDMEFKVTIVVFQDSEDYLKNKYDIPEEDPIFNMPKIIPNEEDAEFYRPNRAKSKRRRRRRIDKGDLS